MPNRFWIAALLMSSTLLAADWREATAKVTPGGRLEVHHQGKIDRGLFALANGNEIVITTASNGFVSIPQPDVDRLIALGTESPTLGYFANANDQLFPKAELVYQRPGAPPAAKRGKQRHWWSKR